MTSRKNWFWTVVHFYINGFRSMTIGRTLWLLIAIKLFIMFFVLKLFFFPSFLGDLPDDASKSDFVGRELVERIR